MLNHIASRLKRLSYLAAGAMLAFGVWHSPAQADPALWVLRDNDSTVYLFGTIHMMKPGVQWQGGDLAAAFSASSELWVEEADDENQQMIQGLVQKYGLDPTHPLSSKLSAPQRQQLFNAARQLKLNPSDFEHLRPWLAALQLVHQQMTLNGYDADRGVDFGLRNAAKQSGRPIRAFETSEQQIRVFADLSPQDELLILTETLRDIDKGPGFISKVLSDWLSGNTSALDQELSADMRTDSSSLYQSLLHNRNVAWARQIEQIMAGKGTSFIAVGTAHLIGDDSVIAMLERDGYKVTRE